MSETIETLSRPSGQCRNTSSHRRRAVPGLHREGLVNRHMPLEAALKSLMRSRPRHLAQIADVRFTLQVL
jgi:hypothetical protein